MQPNPETKIAIVGTGRLGRALAMRLKAVGAPPAYIVSRRVAPAYQLAVESGSQPIDGFQNIPSDAAIALLALPDHVLPQAALDLKDTAAALVHCSGATPISIFPKGRKAGVFWPLQTFSDGVSPKWKGVHVFVEATDEPLQQLLLGLGHLIGGKAMAANAEERQQMHLAAVFANNFTNAFLFAAEQLVGKEKAEALWPMVKETVRKAYKIGPLKAQSGPATRGDEVTIQRHLAMLEGDEDMKKIYRAVTRFIQNRMKDGSNR